MKLEDGNEIEKYISLMVVKQDRKKKINYETRGYK